MAKLDRVLEIEGETLTVPQYVNRTVVGWQVRVRGVPSQHFADAAFGSTRMSLSAAADAVLPMLEYRAQAVTK